MGPICSFGETEKLQKGNRESALPTRWDQSLISVRPKRYEGKQRDYNPISVRLRSLSVGPICLGFVAVAMSSELGGAGLKESVGPSLDLGLGQMWIWESSGGFWSNITKHLSK